MISELSADAVTGSNAICFALPHSTRLLPGNGIKLTKKHRHYGRCFLYDKRRNLEVIVHADGGTVGAETGISRARGAVVKLNRTVTDIGAAFNAELAVQEILGA